MKKTILKDFLKDILVIIFSVAISIPANHLYASLTSGARPSTASRLYSSEAYAPAAEQTTQTQTVNVNSPVIMPEAEPTVNINTATTHELQTLPGIGKTLAARIIENRPYSDPYELMDIEGIGYETLQNILSRLEV